MNHLVYLALGTNLGDRLANLKAAIAGLPPAVRVIASSPVYETPPWGYLDQPAFLNQVARAETELPPEQLLVYLKGLEVQLGRQPSVRNGPRLIDLDILFYDHLILSSPTLTIPHPRIAERAFVLVPLTDLASDLRHPVMGKTIRELAAQVNRSGIALYTPPENTFDKG
ncbi:MAG TPA: 2-amino-4-hydroxy-6-hydroxymethyldihydropteridine diphosphokinase [Anaerolineales bacterium]